MKKLFIFSIFALNLISFNASAQWVNPGTTSPTVGNVTLSDPANNVIIGTTPTTPTSLYLNNSTTGTTTLSIDNSLSTSGANKTSGINFNLGGLNGYSMYYSTYTNCGSGMFHIVNNTASTAGTAGIHMGYGKISFSDSPYGTNCGNVFAVGKYVFDGAIGSPALNIGYGPVPNTIPPSGYSFTNLGTSYFAGLSTFNGGLTSTTGTFSTSLQVGTATTPAPFVLYGALSSSSQTIGYAPGTALPSGMLLGVNGGVAIGLASTTKINTGTTKYNLAVGGGIITDGVTVLLQSSWADYVFAKDYKLMPLSELKVYIDKNKHLPEVPSATEINEKGVEAGEMLNIQMKKIEELTLYMIEMNKKIEALQAENAALKSSIVVK